MSNYHRGQLFQLTYLLKPIPVFITKSNTVILKGPLMHLYKTFSCALRRVNILTIVVVKLGSDSAEGECVLSRLVPLLSRCPSVSKRISTALDWASSEFCKSSRNTVNSPEYRARTLSISALWFTSTVSSCPDSHWALDEPDEIGKGRLTYQSCLRKYHQWIEIVL